jgi:hypothetical protein
MPFSSDAKVIIRGSLSKLAGNGDLQFQNLVPDNSSNIPDERQQLWFIDDFADYITAFPVSSLENVANLDPLLFGQVEFQIPGETGAPEFTKNDICSPAHCSYEFGLDEAISLQGFTYSIDDSEQVISNYVWSILDADENLLFTLAGTRQNDNVATTIVPDNNLFNVYLSAVQRASLGVGNYKVSVTATHTAANDYHFEVLGLNGEDLGSTTHTEKSQLNIDKSVFIETSSIYNLTVTDAQQTVDVPEPRLLFLWFGLFISLMYLGKKRNENRF